MPLIARRLLCSQKTTAVASDSLSERHLEADPRNVECVASETRFLNLFRRGRVHCLIEGETGAKMSGIVHSLSISEACLFATISPPRRDILVERRAPTADRSGNVPHGVW